MKYVEFRKYINEALSGEISTSKLEVFSDWSQLALQFDFFMGWSLEVAYIFLVIVKYNKYKHKKSWVRNGDLKSTTKRNRL